MTSPESALAGVLDAVSLETPAEIYRESFLDGATAFVAEKRLESTYAPFLGYDLHRLRREFSTFVWDLKQLADASRLHSSGYRDHLYWLIDDGEYIGQCSVRTELGTPYLITYGGHIGYSIRPDRRQQGYGRRILALALDVCVNLEMDRILITCDEDNQPSRRIIEANGGQFESSLTMDRAVRRAEGRKGQEDIQKLRYWIELKDRRR
ncbi:MAG: GNAT family N-acetyltransferase [Gemmatimonadetes bacterium]|nr:GNAT family N-acetyltransferase [Gemmatimonadota bacterium]MBT6146717.1 GNAT family N-acetyltransferase [Gemmatimonadota bacterium]MBT7863908.1 GNAT family N-acetyltransferase [Gemmatimonadota bacterium]